MNTSAGDEILSEDDELVYKLGTFSQNYANVAHMTLLLKHSTNSSKNRSKASKSQQEDTNRFVSKLYKDDHESNPFYHGFTLECKQLLSKFWALSQRNGKMIFELYDVEQNDFPSIEDDYPDYVTILS